MCVCVCVCVCLRGVPVIGSKAAATAAGCPCFSPLCSPLSATLCQHRFTDHPAAAAAYSSCSSLELPRAARVAASAGGSAAAGHSLPPSCGSVRFRRRSKPTRRCGDTWTLWRSVATTLRLCYVCVCVCVCVYVFVCMFAFACVCAITASHECLTAAPTLCCASCWARLRVKTCSPFRLW